MDFEIRPSPDAAERQALLEALAHADEAAAGRSAVTHQDRWRRAGVLENLGPDDDVASMSPHLQGPSSSD